MKWQSITRLKGKWCRMGLWEVAHTDLGSTRSGQADVFPSQAHTNGHSLIYHTSTFHMGSRDS